MEFNDVLANVTELLDRYRRYTSSLSILRIHLDLFELAIAVDKSLADDQRDRIVRYARRAPRR